MILSFLHVSRVCDCVGASSRLTMKKVFWCMQSTKQMKHVTLFSLQTCKGVFHSIQVLSDTISMHTYNHTQGILKAHKCLQVRQPPSLRRLCDMPCRSIQHRKRVHTTPTAARFRPCYIYHHSAVFPVPSLSFWQIPCQGMLRVVNGEAGSHLPAMRIVWNGHLHCSL
jgi:hypothetical protein